MRVLLIGDYPPPHGGVAVHVQQLHRFLRAHGVQARVLDIGKGGRPDPDILPARSPRHFALRLAQFSAAGWLIHLHTSGNNSKAWAVVAAAGVSRWLGPRPVVTIHSGLAPALLQSSGARRALTRLALAPFGRVVAVSQRVRDAIERCGVPGGRIVVQPAFLASLVRPGAAPERFGEIRRRRSPLLAMAHHPSPVYGRDLMFAALKALAARFPDVGLALFGPGLDAIDFVRAARLAGVEGLLEPFGELEHPQALALIRGCDAFVRPTLADGDSISVREALALGVPCVASDAADRPEGVRTFPAGDADALVAAITATVLSPPVPPPQPDAGPVLLSLYRELTGGRAPPRLALAR